MAGALVIFIEILLLAVVINVESIISFRGYTAVRESARLEGSKAACFLHASVKADSLLCHWVIGLKQYFQVCDKLLPLPEETYQEFAFLFSGGKSETHYLAFI